MKVIVAGGYGCGTTHVYRIVRAVLEARGIAYVSRGASADVIAAERLLEDPRPHVLKTHDTVVPAAADRVVLLCRRDVYDAAQSHLRRAERAEAVVAGVRTRRLLEAGYAGRTDVTFVDYETFYSRPLAKVSRIAEALGAELPNAETGRIARETGIEATKRYQAGLAEADWITELRPYHVGPADGRPGGGALLPAALKVKIRSVYEPSV